MSEATRKSASRRCRSRRRAIDGQSLAESLSQLLRVALTASPSRSHSFSESAERDPGGPPHTGTRLSLTRTWLRRGSDVTRRFVCRRRVCASWPTRPRQALVPDPGAAAAAMAAAVAEATRRAKAAADEELEQLRARLAQNNIQVNLVSRASESGIRINQISESTRHPSQPDI